MNNYIIFEHSKKKTMKKLLTLLTISLLFSFAANAQSNPYWVRQDTSLRPTSMKLGWNKLDSQFVAWDKRSWKNIPVTLAKTATIDFGQGTSTTVVDSTVSVPGARLGDEVVLGVPHASVTSTGTYFAWVSAANVVTIRFSPKATENPASGVFHVTVIKYKQWY